MARRLFVLAVVAAMATVGGGMSAGADPVDDELEHTPAWEADDDLLQMFLEPPEPRDAEALALANASPHCIPVPALRNHAVDGDVPALQLVECLEAPSLVFSATSIGGCSTPSGSSMSSSTPVWYTVYVDAEFAAHRDSVKEASALNNYLHAMYDGELVHGIFQPKVNFCPNYVLPVPTKINHGDIDTTDDLADLIDYEAGFSDPGQFTLVFGWNKIKSDGSSVNGIALGEIGSSPEATGAYFHYWGGSQYVGFRLAFHEVGHVFDAGHSNCTDHMAQHEFIHIMAFSNDRDPSCNWSGILDHTHWIFKGPDAGDVDSTYAEWCSDRKGSSC